MTEGGCNCGCGKPRDDAIAEIASRMRLNWDQAEALLDESNRTRATGRTS